MKLTQIPYSSSKKAESAGRHCYLNIACKYQKLFSQDKREKCRKKILDAEMVHWYLEKKKQNKTETSERKQKWKKSKYKICLRHINIRMAMQHMHSAH